MKYLVRYFNGFDADITELEEIQEDQRVLKQLLQASNSCSIRALNNIDEDYKVLQKLLKWKNLSFYD